MNILLDKIKYSYKKEFSLEIDLEIPKHKWTMIVGENGSGKSTLLKLLTGVMKPDSGEINIDSSKIGYIFQNPDDQIIQLTIEKELAFNLENIGMCKSDMEQKIDYYLEEYNFQSQRNYSPNQLSGGEKQRLALAATLISDPEILVFDEPTGFLDFKQKEKLYQRVMDFKNKSKTIIWVTHELDELFFADKIIELEKGNVSFQGSKIEYLHKLSNNHIIQEHYLK